MQNTEQSWIKRPGWRKIFISYGVIYLLLLGRELLGRVDDWVYDPFLPVSLSTRFAAAGFGAFCLFMIFRGLVRWFQKINKRRFFATVGCLGTITALLVFISIPNFNRARYQASGKMGLAAGGAKDINAFRNNIENGYLPQPTDITVEGLFYEHVFDTPPGASDKLFSPSWELVSSKEPFLGSQEIWLSAGLHSNLDADSYHRRPLDLVIVLDISGSMSSGFSSYYYDRFAAHHTKSTDDENEPDGTKMEVATRCLAALLDHLNPGDRLGIVLFDNQAYLAKPLRDVTNTDLNAIAGHILDLEPRGGTNMEDGMKMGLEMLRPVADGADAGREHRIIFLTDAQPNTWQEGEETLFGMARAAADQKIHTTFVGVGVDFQTELTEEITKMRGANYFAIHSATEFRKRMDRDFDYLVDPLVFNLSLRLSSRNSRIIKVYGSPEANSATGTLLHVNTLFPSPPEADGVRGGILLVKLECSEEIPDLTLTATWEDRAGVQDQSVSSISQTVSDPGSTATRKGILLARTAELLRAWAGDERGNQTVESRLSRYEQHSLPLRVTGEWPEKFKTFHQHFLEMEQALQSKPLTKLREKVLDPILAAAKKK